MLAGSRSRAALLSRSRAGRTRSAGSPRGLRSRARTAGAGTGRLSGSGRRLGCSRSGRLFALSPRRAVLGSDISRAHAESDSDAHRCSQNLVCGFHNSVF